MNAKQEPLKFNQVKKFLKETSTSYNRYTKNREIVKTIPLLEPCDNTNPELFCYASFKRDDAPDYEILILKSDICEK